MITQLLFGVLMWFLSTVLGFVSFVLPPVLLSSFETGMTFVAQMLSYGPAGLVGLAIVAYMAVDTTLNAFVFAVSTYRLIPGKLT